MSVSRNAVRATTRSLARQPVASTSSSVHLSVSSSSSSSSSSLSFSPTRALSTSATSQAQAPEPVSSATPSASALDPKAPVTHLPPLARQDPQLYTALRPPPLSAIAALASRLKLLPSSLDAESRAKRIQLVHQACTHPSFIELLENASQSDLQSLTAAGPGLVRKHGEKPIDGLQYLKLNPQQVKSQASYATLGNSLLGMLASEFLHLRYPNLPTRVLKAAVAAYVGPSTLADVGTEIGLGGQGILRWNREARLTSKSPNGAGAGADRNRSRALLSRDVSADAMRALVAVVFQELGLSATRNFVNTHLLSRRLNLANLLKFQNPKRALSASCAKYGRHPPESRLIAESGRLSINPIFVVGVWSGKAKLGEGSGSSIKMAEYRAAEDALRRLFLTETPLGDFDVPSVTLDAAYPPSGDGDVFAPNPYPQPQNRTYTPQPLGTCEVMEVAGKSRQ